MMESRSIPAACFALALTVLLSSCGTSPSGFDKATAYHSPEEVRSALSSGPARLDSITLQLELIQQDFKQLAAQKGPGWRKRGYLNSSESDHMETLLFRFTVAQNSITDIISSLGGSQPDRLFPDETLKTAAHVLVTSAQIQLLGHRALLVADFAKDPVAIAKLNEAFFRSEIPGGTYEKLRLSVTSKDSNKRLQAAWVLFEHDRDAGHFQSLSSTDPGYAQLIEALPSEYQNARDALQAVSTNPLSRTLSHSEAASLARKAGGSFRDSKYKARCLLFKDVSRIKNPSKKPIEFTSDQHAQVKSLLQPGDIILTYTAGYASDVFIPGNFKHGMTYIGSPAQRKAYGVEPELLPALAAPKRKAVAQALDQAKDSKGQDADVIEAVAEGVIFNHLGFLMDTHVNRLVVLRPKLSEKERASFIAGVFALHGGEYDFLFDFGDASRQVCTEVIYRAINDRGGIDFPLTKRGGHPTLSADDIVNYHFDTKRRHFDFVLFSEKDSARSGNRAVVHTGTAGEERLRALMSR